MKYMKTMVLASVLILGTVIYNVYDNNRVKIVEQEIKIDNLPDSFKDFTILQLSDLHGEYFGKDQKRLVDNINSIDYDMIAITGDIKSKHEDHIDAFLDIMSGIKDKDHVFFIMGNSDDEKFNEAIINSGCNTLEEPYEFKRGKDSLWINEFIFVEPFEAEGVKVGLNHVPIESDMGYDLVISGHYHGGQYRIPLYGALFIPEINGKGVLPKQSEVSGVIDRDGYVEYISRGLGANASMKFLEFRFFNTPEINVIKLTK